MGYEKKESTRIGAAWKKVSANGNAYISGQFNNGKYFSIFVNNSKVDGSKQPDYRVVMDLDDATEMDLLDEYTINKQAELQQAKDDRANRGSDEDIPF